jgi:ABC-type sugar transport system ATPase subunit
VAAAPPRRGPRDDPPKELYEQPANDFVMGFVGPVSELSKGHAQELELTDGEIVWLRPNAPADMPSDAPVPA